MGISSGGGVGGVGRGKPTYTNIPSLSGLRGTVIDNGSRLRHPNLTREEQIGFIRKILNALDVVKEQFAHLRRAALETIVHLFGPSCEVAIAAFDIPRTGLQIYKAEIMRGDQFDPEVRPFSQALEDLPIEDVWHKADSPVIALARQTLKAPQSLRSSVEPNQYKDLWGRVFLFDFNAYHVLSILVEHQGKKIGAMAFRFNGKIQESNIEIAFAILHGYFPSDSVKICESYEGIDAFAGLLGRE